MADKSDLKRFNEVAELFSLQLASLGLTLVRIQRLQSEEDGWHAKVADLSHDSLSVAIWYDKWLGPKERHFWFGFSGRAGRIKTLYDRARNKLSFDPVVYENDHFVGKIKVDPVRAVRDRNGIVYEKYRQDDHFLGVYDVGFDENRKPVPQAIDFIANLVGSIQPSEVWDVFEIEKRQDIKPTTRAALIEARIGHGRFRERLKDEFEGRCAVTGCKVVEILRASHIKPWGRSNDRERLDPKNGLFLSAGIDALFDACLISFEDNGKIWISKKIKKADVSRLGLKNLSISPNLIRERRGYLKFHRELCLERQSGPF